MPPHVGNETLSKSFNEALRDLAREQNLPLIDYEREIYLRRPDNWNGTLLNTNDVHPSIGRQTARSPIVSTGKEAGLRFPERNTWFGTTVAF